MRPRVHRSAAPSFARCREKRLPTPVLPRRRVPPRGQDGRADLVVSFGRSGYVGGRRSPVTGQHCRVPRHHAALDQQGPGAAPHAIRRSALHAQRQRAPKAIEIEGSSNVAGFSGCGHPSHDAHLYGQGAFPLVNFRAQATKAASGLSGAGFPADQALYFTSSHCRSHPGATTRTRSSASSVM